MNFFLKLRVFFQIQKGLLLQYGWLRSWWAERPVNRYGEAIPWITYPAIDFLSQFDFSTSKVFEWGSGSSTLWWAKRCSKIVSVESNEAWVPYITKLLPKEVELIVTPLDVEEEVRAIESHTVSLWDVIVIDNNGPFRRSCATSAIGHLAEGGVIILDNSDQCPIASTILREKGFCQIDFTGFAPCNGYGHSTSFFFKDRLKFNTIRTSQPSIGPSQPNMAWENC